MHARSPSKWPRSWCLAACFSRSWPPLRRCVHRRPPDAEWQRRSRPARMSAGDARPNDGVWSGSRAVLPIIARRPGRRHRSDRQDRCREARAMATIRSEPAKPPAIWGMSVYTYPKVGEGRKAALVRWERGGGFASRSRHSKAGHQPGTAGRLRPKAARPLSGVAAGKAAERRQATPSSSRPWADSRTGLLHGLNRWSSLSAAAAQKS